MEARLYRKLNDKCVCQLCWRFCKIGEGETGFCKVRVVKGGKLYTLSYGRLSYLESRPIEIKPFFHFLPGSTSMTFSGYSCNLDCHGVRTGTFPNLLLWMGKSLRLKRL